MYQHPVSLRKANVKFQMLIQFEPFYESLVTIRTYKWFFSTVNSTVHIQRASLREFLSQSEQANGFSPGVNSTMHIQVAS